MRTRRKLTSRLSFRVAAPIFILWVAAGFVMYSVVLSTVSDFLKSRIEENVSSLARDVFIICNRNLDALILEGKVGNERYARIVKVRTLSEIEIVLRENNGLALVYEQDEEVGAAPRVLMNMDIPMPEEIAIERSMQEQVLTLVEYGGTLLYGMHFDFEPWDWHIVIFKSNTDFVALQERIRYVYIFTMFALTLGALLVIVLLHYLVNRPLASIIDSIKRGDSPQVKGVYELEFLSESIETMMRSLADMNKRLEHQVAVRTQDLSQKAAELERANAMLTELDRMKSAFLSSVSHELRTPLTSVLGFAKMIDRDLHKHVMPVVQEQGEDGLRKKVGRMVTNLQIIESESERLTRLINDVLDLTRIEDGRMGWTDQPVPLLDAARQAVSALSGQTDDMPGVEMRLEVDAAMPAISIDPDRLQQVLLNLMGNALKFTDAGYVLLSARYAPGEGFRLCVRDTGPGIPREHLLEVFESFYQGLQGDTMLHPQRGTGLGLAICRQIVSHYGGLIWVESARDEGAAVYIEFPPELAAE